MKFYYINSFGQQKGPFSLRKLKGRVTSSTYVWCKGMPDWKRADEVPTLTNILKKPSPKTVKKQKRTTPNDVKEVFKACLLAVGILSFSLYFIISWVSFLGVIGSLVVILAIVGLYYQNKSADSAFGKFLKASSKLVLFIIGAIIFLSLTYGYIVFLETCGLEPSR